MWNLIFSIIIGFEIENKSPDHAETWEPRCRLIQDEDKDGGKRQRGFFATKLTADIWPAWNQCDCSLSIEASTYANLHRIQLYRISVSEDKLLPMTLLFNQLTQRRSSGHIFSLNHLHYPLT